MPTIRADPRTRDIVRRLASEKRISMQEVIRLATKAYGEALERETVRVRAAPPGGRRDPPSEGG